MPAWMHDLEPVRRKIALEQTLLPQRLRGQDANAAYGREMAADMAMKRLEHVGDRQRRVCLQLFHERVAQEAWEDDSANASLPETADHVEDVQLACRSHDAGIGGTCEGTLLEDDVEAARIGVRLGCLDEFQQEIGARERPKAADDAQRPLAQRRGRQRHVCPSAQGCAMPSRLRGSRIMEADVMDSAGERDSVAE